MSASPRPDPLSQDPTCVRCLRARTVKELDSHLWCDECLASARRRAMVRGWMAGGALALVLAAYIAFWIQPDYSLIPAAWVMVLAVAFYLGGRVAREFLFGWERIRNRRAVEATPPVPAPEPEDEQEEVRGWE